MCCWSLSRQSYLLGLFSLPLPIAKRTADREALSPCSAATKANNKHEPLKPIEERLHILVYFQKRLQELFVILLPAFPRSSFFENSVAVLEQDRLLFSFEKTNVTAEVRGSCSTCRRSCLFFRGSAFALARWDEIRDRKSASS